MDGAGAIPVEKTVLAFFSTVWNTQQKKQKCALIWCKIQNKEQTVASEGETLENNCHENEENMHFPK